MIEETKNSFSQDFKKAFRDHVLYLLIPFMIQWRCSIALGWDICISSSPSRHKLGETDLGWRGTASKATRDFKLFRASADRFLVRGLIPDNFSNADIVSCLLFRSSMISFRRRWRLSWVVFKLSRSDTSLSFRRQHASSSILWIAGVIMFLRAFTGMSSRFPPIGLVIPEQTSCRVWPTLGDLSRWGAVATSLLYVRRLFNLSLVTARTPVMKSRFNASW